MRVTAGNAAAASTQAMEAFKKAVPRAPGLMVAVGVLGTAVADVPGMGDAKANWNALAKALEVEYPGLIGNAVFLSRADWIADDREAFLHAVQLFGGDLQKLSGLCYNLEGQVDQVRDAYNYYWLEAAALAGTVLGYVAAAHSMKALPHLRFASQVWLEKLVALTNWLVAQNTKILAAFLGVAGTTFGTALQSMGQMFNIEPTDGVAIDFKRAVISTTPPSLRVAPKRELPEPYQADPPEK
ncbi:hypothetical protein [Planomonospora parontospora]|uniref:hypothetical protein n=1 Tax=Planomonospora parontospora TaxID=58119 RepID=UPI00166FC70F|nr:hypothetical protein [Planomonospora parontospora]GGL56103.1 hypothetical protein GCM10014719_66790 [Planomonospora parontospora subsp. antibiotica]GII19146.1 hypothetical protein Ppa05_58720 [Planomonospora parontospora subsp. antibiotica]